MTTFILGKYTRTDIVGRWLSVEKKKENKKKTENKKMKWTKFSQTSRSVCYFPSKNVEEAMMLFFSLLYLFSTWKYSIET